MLQDEEEHDEVVEDPGVEVERLEKEVSDEDALSEEQPAAEAEGDDKSEGSSIKTEMEQAGNYFAPNSFCNSIVSAFISLFI